MAGSSPDRAAARQAAGDDLDAAAAAARAKGKEPATGTAAGAGAKKVPRQALDARRVVALQRAAGNRAMTAMLRPPEGLVPLQREDDTAAPPPPPAPSPNKEPAPPPPPDSSGPPGSAAPPGSNGGAGPPGSSGSPGGDAPPGSSAPPAPPGGPDAPAPQSPGQAAARPGGVMGPAELGGGYVEGNQYVNTMGGPLSKLFEERADPKAKESHNELMARADATRLDSLQYNYAPGGFTNALLSTIMPGAAFVDSLRKATTQNAYASGASFSSWSGAIAGLQTGIEFIRGVGKAVGEVAGAASTVLAIFSAITGALSLIPPLAPVTGPLAGASLAASAMLGIVKTGIDLTDAALAIVQMLLSVARARLTDDPVERARIAQLLKKESGDFSASLINGAIGAATAGVGSGAARLATGVKKGAQTAATEAAKQTGKVGVKEFWEGTLKGARKHMANFVRSNRAWSAAAKSGDVAAMGKALSTKVPEGAWGQLRELTPLTEGFGLYNKNLARRLATVRAVDASMGPAGKLVERPKDIEANEAGGGPPGMTADGGGPDVGLTYRKTAYWPSVLEKMGNIREWIHNAQSRMKDQYFAASADAGDKKSAVRRLKGSFTQMGTRMRMAGGKQQQLAGKGEAKSKEMASTAAKAKDKKDEAAGKGGEAKDKADETKAKTEESKAKAQSTQKPDMSLWERAKQWLYDKTLGKLFKGLAAIQKWIGDGVLKIALWASGLEKDDLDLAGMKEAAEGDAATDAKTKGDAGDVKAKGDTTDQAVADLKASGDSQQKAAIEGMVDTGDWITALDTYDQALAQRQDHGNNYLNDARGYVKEEVSAELVTSISVAPIRKAYDFLKSESTAIPQRLQKAGAAGVEGLVAEIGRQPGANPSPGKATAEKVVAKVVADAQSDCEMMARGASRVWAQAMDLIDTDQFAYASQLAGQMDSIGRWFAGYPEKALGRIKSGFDAIATAYAQVYQDALNAGEEGGPEPAAPAPAEPPEK